MMKIRDVSNVRPGAKRLTVLAIANKQSENVCHLDTVFNTKYWVSLVHFEKECGALASLGVQRETTTFELHEICTW